MTTAFDWLNKLMEGLIEFIPQRTLIRSTHGGVKYKWGKDYKLKPGFHWWWPLTTEIDQYPTIRQTCNLENQTLTTKDGHVLGLSGIVVYYVVDAHQFLTSAWDGEDTIRDIVLSTIYEYVESQTLEDIRQNFKLIRKHVASGLSRFGIRVAKVALSHSVVCKEVYGIWPAGGGSDARITKNTLV